MLYLEAILFTYFMLHAILKAYRKSYFGRCTSNRRLRGKTVIITGATQGIGKQTALDLAVRGAKVIIPCRNLEAGNTVREQLIKRTGNENIVIHHLDLESLDSVRDFAQKINSTEDRLDVLVNNAGIFGGTRKLTNDGIDPQMQINYLAPFLLTNLLTDLLKKTPSSRIVNVSSQLYSHAKNISTENLFDVSGTSGYCVSKLYLILMTNELANRLKSHDVICNSVHPGTVSTNIFANTHVLLRVVIRALGALFLRTTKEGAQTTIEAAVSEKLDNTSGKYLSNCKVEPFAKIVYNEELSKTLWHESCKKVGLQSI